MSKSSEKKGNKAVIITSAVCAAVVAVIVLILALTDPIVGNIKLGKVRDAAQSCGEIVISAPLYKNAFLQGTETVVSGEDARELADAFLSATENTSFDKSFESAGGFWNIKMEFYSSDDRYAVYLRDEEIYVAKNFKGYLFEIDDESETAYQSFYNRVLEILDKERAT